MRYWQQKEVLPTSLSDMGDAISNTVTPKDLENKSDYIYKVLVPKLEKVPGTLSGTSTIPSFELCAVFALPTQDTQGRGGVTGGGIAYTSVDVSYPVYGGDGNDNWKHNAGQQCFTRSIDPSAYPPYKN